MTLRIHISQLSNKKTVISIEENVLVFSKTHHICDQLKAKSKLFLILKKCSGNWCKVK